MSYFLIWFWFHGCIYFVKIKLCTFLCVYYNSIKVLKKRPPFPNAPLREC